MNNNYMEETLGYGLDTGLYESFLDGLQKNYDVENVNSLVATEEVEGPQCHGLFTELGFSEEIPVPKWSLAEQMGWASNTCTPSLEDIVDEACSPLSTGSAFLEETCLPSPQSDSGISCSSPHSNAEVEELESGLWGSNKLPGDINWSDFNIPNEGNQESQNFENGNANAFPTFDILSIPDMDTDAKIIPQTEMQIFPASPCTDTQEMPFVSNMEGQTISNVSEAEIKEMPQENNAFVQQNETSELNTDTKLTVQNITPLSIKKQKLFIVKAIPVRPAPYNKPVKTKTKQRTKQQKERKKHQNRDAALRYRNKKKGELEQLFDEADRIEKCNKELTDKVTEITKEIDYLKSLMLDVIKARLSKNNTLISA